MAAVNAEEGLYPSAVTQRCPFTCGRQLRDPFGGGGRSAVAFVSGSFFSSSSGESSPLQNGRGTVAALRPYQPERTGPGPPAFRPRDRSPPLFWPTPLVKGAQAGRDPLAVHVQRSGGPAASFPVSFSSNGSSPADRPFGEHALQLRLGARALALGPQPGKPGPRIREPPPANPPPARPQPAPSMPASRSSSGQSVSGQSSAVNPPPPQPHLFPGFFFCVNLCFFFLCFPSVSKSPDDHTSSRIGSPPVHHRRGAGPASGFWNSLR